MRNYPSNFTEEVYTGSKSSHIDEELCNTESLSINKGTVHNLNRSLSTRHINMIAIGGTIGSGLFLGTGKSLANGGPVSLLICYLLIGVVVYITLLSLGEMSTLMPISGSFCTYARRFGSESLGFTILANYWFNDAVSVASDLTALQLILSYWTDFHYWVISLIVWVVLLGLNVFHVRFYGETEYWLALLKIIAILIFFIISIVVNAGHNNLHEYIGFKYWSIGEAPVVDGFKGFAKVFVTASFAYGGTESLTLTAGEAVNPVRNTPKVIKTVFWRILFFYVLTVFFIGMNVPYNYPNLSTGKVITSPFTIVFQMVGAKAAGSFMNAVILTSVISAGNHALYAGSRLLYTLGTDGYLPKFLTKTNRYKAPYVSVIITWFVGGLCFGSSFISAGTLWSWLQSIVGVSNQLSWWTINITALRFRRGLKEQGKVNYLRFKNWTYPWGNYFCVVFITFIVLVQGWSSFAPWDVSSFFQNYIELGVFPLLYLIWWFYKRDSWVKSSEMDFETDRYFETEEELELNERLDDLKGWPKWRHRILEFFS
ncbi:hypothetical protein DASC09_020900 [Saccharomycopsis crataegensis]|uniref:Amino acid permease/ SLC12A domain-containing protein n=1 Tax=Saccharomycopsis crataegensis TaxID=43959 RepID=A0AAV5QIJ8_9ASCO|nr:hypothetical protein DASC09_020900 [Saccharomycopsis crataegensis]